jgi:hypothetical protein
MTSYYGSPEGKEVARKEVAVCTCPHVEPVDDPNTIVNSVTPDRDFISTQAANRFPLPKCKACSPSYELLDPEAAARLSALDAAEQALAS